MWDGVQWTPVPVAASEAPTSARSTLTVAGGIAAIAGIAMLLGASFLPYVSWTATADYPAGSYSIFGFGIWEIASVAVTLAAGIGAAIILFVLANRLAIALAAGLLVAFGLDAVTGWVANSGTYAMEGLHIEPGAFLGFAGGAILMAGGVMASLSLLPRRAA